MRRYFRGVPDDIPERWLPASISDLEGLEIELPIAEISQMDPFSFSSAYAKAADCAEKLADAAAARVFRSMATVCSAVASFDTPDEPFKPSTQGGGRRSLVPDDFTEADISLLKAIFPALKNSWLRARFCDCVYIKEKASRAIWALAVSAYLQAARECYPQEAKEGLNCFTRALSFGRVLGRDSQPRKEAIAAVIDFAEKNLTSLEARDGVGLLRLIQQDGIGDPLKFAQRAETLAGSYVVQAEFGAARSALKISSLWWGQLGEDGKQARTTLDAAGLFGREGEHFLARTPPMLAAAIESFLRGISALQQSLAPTEEIERLQKQVRQCQRAEARELHNQVWGKTAMLPDPLTNAMAQARNEARKRVADIAWPVALARLAFGLAVTSPSKVEKEVPEFAEIGILTFLLTKTYPGEKGRTAYRQTSPFLKRGDAYEDAMKDAQFEHARRYIWDMRANGFIEPCRQQIWEDHQPSLHDWGDLVSGNPIIPASHAYAFMRGLQAGIAGDWLVAGHILAVKIESVLRHVLDQKDIETAFIANDLTQPNKMFGSLVDLAEEKGSLPPEYIFEFRGLLLEKAGYGFRNRIAHGFATDAECYETAAAINIWWLVLRMCFCANDLIGEVHKGGCAPD